MNYSGKFDAKLATDGSGPSSHGGYFHVDTVSTHAPSGAILVPDGNLLFNGDFKRSGVDLVLSKDDHQLVLHDYFKGEKRAALASPDGAHLTGDIVNALIGEVQYSQADGHADAAAKVIGHVTKITGTATAIRNGVSIVLNAGDNVEKGDVVQTGSDSTLGITFIDGTVFGLSHNARMVLNEMIYDPNGSNNSSLLSLVSGTISFVAGETAKHGDMKVDTPVATMGIRGTAVLVEIDFNVPAQGGVPPASFQVLVEPDGSTGSYILFDKTTLNPIATVNQAGTQTVVNGQGVVSFLTTAPLSSDAQKVITDVFAMKFSDLNSNTKTTTAQTDSIVPVSFGIKLANGDVITPTIYVFNTLANSSGSQSSGPLNSGAHIPGPPVVNLTANSAFSELTGVTGSSTLDSVTGLITFTDVNLGDRPTVHSITFTSAAYQDANGNPITTLTPTEAAAINAIELASLTPVPNPANTNNGSDTWTYSLADKNFDFLAAGEVLTLTYTAAVYTNFAPDNEEKSVPFTITITGTNDAPVITSPAPVIPFAAGTGTVGGDLQTVGNAPTTGTLTFTDVDLTDTHTIAVALVGTTMDGNPVDLSVIAPTPLAAFETALTADFATSGADSTGTGTGTITWQLAELPVYLADFVPLGETLTLTYAVTVTDEHGASSTQDVVVTITGTDAAAVVWIATNVSGTTDWNTKTNWGTGKVPTLANGDDAIIITNQLQPNTPLYPVTIDAPASARSVTMNDFSPIPVPPELDNNSTLTIGSGGFSLNADSIVKNAATAIISVAGAMDVAGTSQVTNSGTITLADGGIFEGQSTISNTGTGKIEISGGTLDVEVSVANAGLVTIDGSANLTLNSGAIDGGIVTNNANGEIDLTGSGVLKNGHLGNSGQIKVSGTGNSLDNEIVNNSATIEILTGGVLTIDGGTVIDGSSVVTIDSGGTLDISGTGSIVDSLGVADAGTLDISATTSGASITTLSGAGKVTLGTQTLTLTAANSSFSGVISGTGGLTLTTGTETLSGDNLYSGVTTINGGTLALSGSGSIAKSADVDDDGTLDISATSGASIIGLSGSGAVTLGAATLTLSDAGAHATDTFSGAIDGSGGLTLTTGTETLSGDNLYSGVTTINGGTLALSGSGSIAKSADVVDDGTLDISATSGASIIGLSGSGAVTLGAATLTLSDAGAHATDTFSGAIDGSGGLTLTTGTETLSGDNLYSGVTTINGGTLALSGSGSIAKSADVDDDGTLDISATSGASIIGLSGSGAVTLGAATLTLSDAGAHATDTFSGAIDGSGGLTLTTGTETLSGDNLYSGVTTINGGTLALSGSGSIAKSADVVDDGTLDISATSGASIIGLSGSGAVTLGAQTLTLSDAGAHATDTFSGAIDGSGGLTLTTGTETLSGDNLYSGVTTINGGTLALSGSGSIAKSADVVDDGTLDISATSGASIIGLSGSGAVTLGAATLTLSDAGAHATDTFSGAIDGSGGLTLTTGTETLSGDNLYSGVTTINGGTLALSGSGSIAKSADVVDDGTLDISATSGASIIGLSGSGAVTLGAATLTLSDAGAHATDTFSGAIDGSGGLTLTTGTETLSGDNLYSGVTTINGGTLALSGSGSIAKSADVVDDGTLDISATSGASIIGLSGSGAVTLGAQTLTLSDAGAHATDTFSGAIDGSGGLTLTTGTETLSGDNLYSGVTTINGGTLALSGSGSIAKSADIVDDGTLDISATSGASIIGLSGSGAVTLGAATLTLSDAGAHATDTFSGAIDGSGGLTLTTGTETLSGDNLYSGVTTINGGTLALSGSGSIAKSADVVDDGTLDISATSGASIIGLSGSGAVTLGAATLTLSDAGAHATDTFSGAIDGSGGLTLTTGTETLSGDNLYSGVTTINGGTLALSGSGSIAKSADIVDDGTLDISATSGASIIGLSGSGAVTLGAATLTLSDAGAHATDTFSGAIDGSGGLTLTTGTETLSGDNLYSGVTTINGGTLALSGSGSIAKSADIVDDGTLDISATSGASIIGLSGSGAVTLGAATLTLSDAGAHATDTFSGAIDGSGGLTLTTGTETLSGDNLYSGVTTINGGTLALSGSGSIAKSADVVDDGTLDISATSGASIIGLSGSGAVTLGAATLTLSDAGAHATDTFSGAIDGSGGLTLTTGTETLSGDNLYSGVTTINGGTLALSGSGSIAKSTDVVDDGTLDISATSGASITTLSGSGDVTLGTQTLTLTAGTGSFSGAISGTGGLIVDGTGTETLSGTNTYSIGSITIGGGETLALSGPTISGSTLTVSGTLDSTGTSFITGAMVTNSGTLESTSGTLTIDSTSTLDNTGTLAANGGTLVIDTAITGLGGSATIGSGGTLEIGTGATDSQSVTFNSSGTLQLDDLTSFTGPIYDLAVGDIIDLSAAAVPGGVTTVVASGSTLIVNGASLGFSIASLPAGDTFGFKSDGHGGFDLAVLAQIETAGSTSAAQGTEGTPITLNFTDALIPGSPNGAALTSFTISGIPDGATMADANGPLTIVDGTVTVDPSQVASLTITPGNDTNFTLTAIATATDSQGYEYTVPTSETVIVNPAAPTVTWNSGAVSVTEGQSVAIGFSATVNSIAGATGDGVHNTISSLVITGIPDGAILSDGTPANTVTVTDGTLDVTGWNVSTLTITPPNDTNFTLTVTATEQDADNPAQTSTATATETVTVSPEAPAVTWGSGSASGTEGTAIALEAIVPTVNSIAGATGDGAHNTISSLVITGIPDGAILSDGTPANTVTVTDGTLDVTGWNVSTLTITPPNDTNFTLTVTATEQDADNPAQTSTATATETVTVSPEAPAVTWGSGSASGTEGTAIALEAIVPTVNSITGATGDGVHNTISSLVITGIPDGAILSDGTPANTVTVTDGTLDVTGWNVSTLTITPPNDTNFTLTVTATEQDADNPAQTSTATATETVTVSPEAPAVTWGSGSASGTEGTAIALEAIVPTVNSIAGATGDGVHNTISSLVITGIPDGAILSDGTPANTVTVTDGTLDVTGWNVSTLTITPPNDTNFTLTVTATEQDADNPAQTSTATATETVTVSPEAPAVTWGSGSASGTEGTAIALEAIVPTVNSITGATGDGVHNTISSLVITGIPDGAILSDGTPANTVTVTDGTLDVTGWNVSTLTITPPNDTNFTLTVTATEQDADNPAQTSTATATETVTVSPEAPAVTWGSGSASGTEGTAIALEAIVPTVNSITGATGDGAHNTISSLVITGIPDGAILSDGTPANTVTVTDGTLDVTGWNVSTLTITPPNDTNFTLTVTATEQDADNPAQTSTATATETVTVSPEAPAVTWGSGSASGTEGTAIALEAIVPTVNSITGATGDGVHNTISSLVITGIPDGAILSDGTPANTVTVTDGTLDVTGWNVSTLTITPPNDTNFTLTVTATEQDADNPAQTSTATATETVTVTPSGPQTDHWTDAASTADHLWTTDGNWSLGAPPATGDIVDVGGTPLNPAQIDSSLTLDGNSVTLLDNGAYGEIDVVSGATLTLDDGTTITGGGTSGGVLSIDATSFLDIASTGSGATLDGVTVTNYDTIHVDAGATLTIADTVTLQGGGTVELASAADQPAVIGGIGSGGAELDNVDNTISGSGTIGSNADGTLTLNNETGGTIDANDSSLPLTISTGNQVTNAGLIEATNGGTLYIDDSVNLTGILKANGGTIVINNDAVDGPGSVQITGGGTVDFADANPSQNVTFTGTGTLELFNSLAYSANYSAANGTGAVTGFSGGDIIDLQDINYASNETATWTENAGNTTGILTIVSGATTETLHLNGYYSTADFTLVNDGHGGTDVVGSLIVTPATGTIATAFETLNYPGAYDASGTGSYASGINDLGEIVGGASTNSNNNSVGWEYNGSYTTLIDAGAQDNDAVSVNDSGEIVGFYAPHRSTPRYGFTDVNGTYTQVASDSPYPSTTLNGINNAGVMVGGAYLHPESGVTPEYSGFIYSGGTFTYFNAPGTTITSGYTYAEGINNEGDVVGVYSTNYGSQPLGFLYQNGNFTTISDPLGTGGTAAYGINDAGEIVGFYTDSSGHQHGFVDIGGTFTTIDDPLGVDTTITGINNAGQIVGFYVDSNNVQHGFVASLNNVSTNEDQALTLTTLGIADSLAGSGTVEVTIDAGHGNLSLADIAGLSVSGQDTDALTLSGSVAALEAALASGLIYTPTLGYTGADSLTVTASDSGHNASNTPINSTQYVGIVVDAVDQIASGATYDPDTSVTFSDTVKFLASTGTLQLDTPSNFAGEITGISGSDTIDLSGFNAAMTTVSGSFNSTTDATTLTVHDASDSHTITLTLAGDYSTSTWTWTASTDNHGGTDIVGAPASQATIAAGATLDVSAASSESVTFAGGTGSLVLDNPSSFTGQISGFTGTAPDAQHSDTIDLVGINYNSGHFSETYDTSTDLLTVSDGSHQAAFTLVDFNGTLDFASDNDGGTLILDPPANTGTGSTPIAYSIAFPNESGTGHSGSSVPSSHVGDGADGEPGQIGGLPHNTIPSSVGLTPIAYSIAFPNETGTGANPAGGASGDQFVFNNSAPVHAGVAGESNGFGGWLDGHGTSPPTTSADPPVDHALDVVHQDVASLLKLPAFGIQHVGDFHFSTS